MHPLHEYIAKQLVERLRTKSIVVWYDSRGEFVPFIAELCGGARFTGMALPITIAGVRAHLVEYAGSMLEVRITVESFVNRDVPDRIVAFLPRCERDRRASFLMELEKAGECYEPQLKRLARNVLRQRYTDGVIDDMLAPERVSYADLARASSETSSSEAPSLLKSIFYATTGRSGLLGAWLANGAKDPEIEIKEAIPELRKLVKSRLGLELSEHADLGKLRSVTWRYVLAGEFRSDLDCTPPAILDSVPVPGSKEQLTAVRDLARSLRADFPEKYSLFADRVEAELGLATSKIPGAHLGSIDTFRFQERAVLAHCSDLISAKHFEKALVLIGGREQSYWLDSDVGRKAEWEAFRRMAELGRMCVTVHGALRRFSGDANAWIEAYTSSDGWFRLDQAQRRLETWVANLEDDPHERPLAVVRGVYDETCRAMGEGFTRAMLVANWAVSARQQTRTYADFIAPSPKPVAYFLVDAMRFEMGLELAERLPKTAEVFIHAAVACLPSITPVGMAGLQPCASSSFSVVEENKTLGARIEGSFLPDLAARKRFATSRVPNLVDLSLDELLSVQPSKLLKKVEAAHVIFVRSREIDQAGEGGFTFQARQVMDTVIDNLARAIRKLSGVGIAHAVVTSDHGHLFFPIDRDESMRIDPPGGDTVQLHRRCWIGRGGSTPTGCIRVTGAALGYDSDLDFVFPLSSAVFKAGGDLAFHHGGPSLQELMIPVLKIRTKAQETARSEGGPVTVSGIPEAVTNRIFSVAIHLEGRNPSLFSTELTVRPLLVSSGKQVGSVGMAVNAELDRVTGCIKLSPAKPATVALVLNDESVASLRIVVQDSSTDAELYRSPQDIPVRLGV